MKKPQKAIDKDFYDGTGYFEGKSRDLTDFESPFQRYRISKILGVYTPKPEDVVVDMGCGWGTVSFSVAPLCSKVYGIDFSEKSMALCNGLLKKKKYSNVSFLCRDARATGMENASCDVIICADLFEHLYRDVYEKVLDECARILRKGGKLSIWTPHRGHIFEVLKNHNIILKKDPSHVDYKSMPGILEDLDARGFRILKAYYAESHIPILGTMEKALLPYVPAARRRIAVLAEKK